MKHILSSACALLLAPVVAHAAINPAEYTRHAPYQLQLKPLVQIVEHSERDGDTHRRTTIVATVVAEFRDVAHLEVGDTVTIDWTVNIDAEQRARAGHDRTYGTMPGPQFLHEPVAPLPDEQGLFWANLKHDDTVIAHPAMPPSPTAPLGQSDQRMGDILVPAAHQYTFDRPG